MTYAGAGRRRGIGAGALTFLGAFIGGPMLIAGFLVALVAAGAADLDLCRSSLFLPTATATDSVSPSPTAPGEPAPEWAQPAEPAPSSSESPTTRPQTLPMDASVAGFDRTRLLNAITIAVVAQQMGLGERGQYLGILAAIGESSLENIAYGDWEVSGVTNPDGSRTTSVGLFQQQENWGPIEVRMDPAGASRLFFERLSTVPDWSTGVPTLVIHAVQGNLDPFHYARYQAQADAVFAYIAPYIGAANLECTGTSNGFVALPLDPGFIMTDTFGPRIAPVAGASSWHPAYDLIVPGLGCEARVYSVSAGVVVTADNSWLNVRTDTGETIGYLHSSSSTYQVQVGDRVAPGQFIARIGNEGASSGCHLDLRIDATGTVDPIVASLPTSGSLGGSGNYVNPALYFEARGLVLCDAACLGGHTRGVGA